MMGLVAKDPVLSQGNADWVFLGNLGWFLEAAVFLKVQFLRVPQIPHTIIGTIFPIL